MKPPRPRRSAFDFDQETRLTPAAPRDVAVLIPAFAPTESLIDLVDRLSDAGVPAVLVVDDGSPADAQPLFELLASNPRVHLLRHPGNEGKGSALKTGIRYFLRHQAHLKGLVTADADGQHAADDVVRVARALHRSPRLVIVGARNFDVPLYPAPPLDVPPLRSLIGNRVTALLFRWMTGVPLADAQCGLRALPTSLLPALLKLPGRRYEYEMSMLVWVAQTRHPLAEQPIRTLYGPGTPESHFRPMRDSARVLRALFARGSVVPLRSPPASRQPGSEQQPAADAAAAAERAARAK
ncbi:MAG: glycosyltransferase family 2 protein [Acidobacteriota bacterium]|nr:glycosyltransferase family 2 protein [Acidobacteriota bacterium]